MSELTLSRDEVRSLDAVAIQEVGVDGIILMENAARGVCDQILRGPTPTSIHIFCGPGNNGGDGFALARQLAANNLSSVVWLQTAGKPLTDDSNFNRRAWLSCGGGIHVDTSPAVFEQNLTQLGPTDLVVDCLLGTGVRGAPREPFARLISAINESPAEVLAVDLPSGLDCDSGEAEGECVQASRTVTFVAMKRGFCSPSAVRYTGDVTVAHIGLPTHWVAEWVIAYRSSLGTDG